MSLMVTPAPIIAVNRGVLDQQGITSLQEAIRNLSGVTQAGNNYNIGDNLVIRGLDANFTLDGMYSGAGLGNNYNPTRSLTNVERIEVLKGPVTGLYGIGSAGGVINFVEKKPEFTKKGLAEVTAGQWNSYRGMLDYTAPISDKFAYRFVGAAEVSDGYRDVSMNRYEVYGSLRFKSPDDVHNLTLSTAAIHDSYDVDAIGDPVRLISPDLLDDFDWTSLTNDFTLNDDGSFTGLQLTDEQRQILASSLLDSDGVTPYDIGDHSLITGIADPNKGKEYRVKLTYDVQPMENLTLSNKFLYRTYESEFTRQTGGLNYVYYLRNGVVNVDPRAPLIIDDVIYPLAARRQEYRHVEVKEKAFQYFGDFRYDWKLGNIKGEHLLSANFENRNVNYDRRSIVDADNIFGTGETNVVPYILDVTDEDAINSIDGDFEDFAEVTRRTTIYETTVAAYGTGFQEVLYLLDDKLTARIGGAYSTVNHNFRDVDAESDLVAFDDAGFSYNFGLNFRPIDQISIFGNYARGRTNYSLSGAVDEDNEINREDSESLSIDLGLRFKTKDDSLLASLVFFQTALTNQPYTNPAFDEDDLTSTELENLYDAENRVKGVELDVNYNLTNKFSLNANATFQDPRSIFGDDEDEDETLDLTKGVPNKFARFWAEYKYFFKNSNNPLLFNFGVRYEDEKSLYAPAFELYNAYVPSYVVLDTGLGYNLDNKWNFRLNVNNLLNEYYYSKAMFAGGLPGEARNFQLSVRRNF